MPRRGNVPKREILPDPVYNSVLVSKLNIKVGITADDADMIAYMNHYEIPYTIVATKCDKLNKTTLAASAQKLVSDLRIRHGTECILFSSEKGLGREEVWKRVVQYKQ